MVTYNAQAAREAFSKRLNKALDEIGWTVKGKGRQVELAKLLKVSQKGARKWLEGEAFPTRDNMVRLAELCFVSYEWLELGKDPMRITHTEPTVRNVISEPPPPPNDNATLVLQILRGLTKRQATEWIQIGHNKSQENKEILTELKESSPDGHTDFKRF